MEKNKALDAAISQIKEKQLLNEEEKTNKEKFTYKLDKPLSNTEEFELAGRVLKEQKKKEDFRQTGIIWEKNRQLHGLVNLVEMDSIWRICLIDYKNGLENS